MDTGENEQFNEESDQPDSTVSGNDLNEQNEKNDASAYDVSAFEALNPSIRRNRPSVVSDDHQVELDYEEEEFDVEPNLSKGSGLDDSEIKENTSTEDPSADDKEKKLNGDKENGETKEAGAKDSDNDEDGEAHSTDGELTDDDCEEGEIKESGLKKPFVRPMCRFYTRGQCTWGNNCRFLHPGVNDKGNYSMIDQGGFPPMGPPSRSTGHRRSDSGGEPPAPAPAVEKEDSGSKSAATTESSGTPAPGGLTGKPATDPESETAWERGLRHAKEIKRKRKEGGTVEETPGQPGESIEMKTEPTTTNQETEKPPAFTRHVPPAPRDPYYDEMARSGYDADDYYNRLPAPPAHPAPPHHDPWGPPPPYGDPYFMRWPPRGDYPPEYGMPLPPPPDFRMMDRERMYGRRLSPPPRMDYYRRGGPPPPGGRAPSNEPPYYGPKSGEDWRDPWLRTKSPRRRRYSSRSRSRSGSGSYSSTGSSYSSRSRSGSSSYTGSSYTGSSRSSYTYSGSLSSSRSRSPVRGSKRRKAGKKHLNSAIGGKQGNIAGDVTKIGTGLTSIQLPAAPPTRVALSLGGDISSSLPSKQALSQAVAAAAADKAGKPLAPFSSKPLVVPTSTNRAAPLQPVGKSAAAAFAPEPPAPPRPAPGGDAVNHGFPRVSDLTRLPGMGRQAGGTGGTDAGVKDGTSAVETATDATVPGASVKDSGRRRSSRSGSRYRSSSRSYSRSRSSSRSDSRSSYTPPSRRGGRKRSGGKRGRRSSGSSRSSSRSRSAESDVQYGEMASPISSASSTGGDKSPNRPAPSEKPSAPTAPRNPGDNLRGRSERGDPTEALRNLEQRRAAMRGGMGHPPPHPGMREHLMYPPMHPGARMDHRAMRGMHPRDMRGGRPPMPPMDYPPPPGHRGPDPRGGPPPMDMRHARGDMHMRGMRMDHHREHRESREQHRDRVRERSPAGGQEGNKSPRDRSPGDAQESRRSAAPPEVRAPSPRGREGDAPPPREHHRGGLERQQGVATDRRDIRQGRGGEMGGSADVNRPRRVSTSDRAARESRGPAGGGASRPDAKLRPDRAGGGADALSPTNRKRAAPDSTRGLSPSAVKQARHSDSKSTAAAGAGDKSSRQSTAAGVGKSPGKAAPAGGARKKSRREELLMQLKAVEDAIAKKRSKIP